MGLLDSLGLDKVESDPNNIPDGRYVGDVFKDEIVVKKDDTVNLVLTYRVTEGDHKGAQRTEWYALGKDPVRDETTKAITSYTPTMSEQAKSWFKKRLEDLNLNIATYKPGDATGKKVNFGVKRNDSWVNVNFVELREAPTTPQPGAVAGNL